VSKLLKAAIAIDADLESYAARRHYAPGFHARTTCCHDAQHRARQSAAVGALGNRQAQPLARMVSVRADAMANYVISSGTAARLRTAPTAVYWPEAYLLRKQARCVNMNPKTSNRIIAASGMAVVIGIGVVVFAMRSHPVAPTAAFRRPPGTGSATTDTPVAAQAAAPEAPAAVPDGATFGTPAREAAPADRVEPPLTAHSRHQTVLAGRYIASSAGVVTSLPTSTGNERPAAVTPAEGFTPLQGLDPVALAASTEDAESGSPALSASADLSATDSQITTNVESAIAGDSLSKDLNIAVSTTRGIVALTGTVANQGAIDELTGVAKKVKDVKGVDTSALIVASL
jgi:hyperosmotically inducible protein